MQSFQIRHEEFHSWKFSWKKARPHHKSKTKPLQTAAAGQQSSYAAIRVRATAYSEKKNNNKLLISPIHRRRARGKYRSPMRHRPAAVPRSHCTCVNRRMRHHRCVACAFFHPRAVACFCCWPVSTFGKLEQLLAYMGMAAAATPAAIVDNARTTFANRYGRGIGIFFTLYQFSDMFWSLVGGWQLNALLILAPARLRQLSSSSFASEIFRSIFIQLVRIVWFWFAFIYRHHIRMF